MELKTKIAAETGKQELRIVRQFDLPVHLLFRAYTEPDLLAQWMGTQVIQLENRNQGAWRFVTTDPMGNKHGFSGVIHEFTPEKRIIRTFQMENTAFEAQLEFLEFEGITKDTSELNIHILFKSVEMRDMLLQMPFAQGLNFAHNRLEKIKFI